MAPLHRTRIKICGLTRETDVAAVVGAGADAIGFVFYPKSPRYVAAKRASELARHVPPFVSTVGLFVNPQLGDVRAVLTEVPLTLLQFHGDETPQECATIADAVVRPFVRAARVGSTTKAAELLDIEAQYRAASPYFTGLLLDTLVEEYGGSGKVFDWSVVPEQLGPRAVLSGGLTVDNVAEAVTRVRPYAVDISSGVEAAKGIKDTAKVEAFVRAVRQADIKEK